MKISKENNYFIISILFSLISIFITLFINYQIAEQYLKSDNKTKAIFLPELLMFPYQDFVIILGMISFVFSVILIKNKDKTNKNLIALLLSLFAIMIVFIRIWKIFV